MPTYVSLINWTQEGISNVMDSPKRADAFIALALKLGAVAQIWYTMGQYDAVSIIEAPSDAIVMQLLFELRKLGNVKTQTMKAWSPPEAAKLFARLNP